MNSPSDGLKPVWHDFMLEIFLMGSDRSWDVRVNKVPRLLSQVQLDILSNYQVFLGKKSHPDNHFTSVYTKHSPVDCLKNHLKLRVNTYWPTSDFFCFWSTSLLPIHRHQSKKFKYELKFSFKVVMRSAHKGINYEGNSETLFRSSTEQK